MLELVKKILPKSWLNKIRPFGHGFLAYSASFYYRNPSNKMVVIGITGTAGKSTTAQILTHILNAQGKKAGYITTVSFFDGDTEQINKQGMSMPGRFTLQEQLSAMLKNGCEYAVIECTSEGLAQNRHLGINFDIAMCTNLSPAHIEAHGGYDNYRKAKGKLFQALSKGPSKKIFPYKTIGVNLMDKEADYFLSFEADNKFGIAIADQEVAKMINGQEVEVYRGWNMKDLGGQTEFSLEGVEFVLNMLGAFNGYNTMLAIACADVLGVSLESSASTLLTFHGPRGRMEQIPNNRNIKIILDYAPEPAAMENSLKALTELRYNKLIHVFGSTGGHRDVQKRFIFGQISSKYADTIIITNDDVYDSDPQEIANNVREGIENELNKKTKEVITILDRKEAIKKALEIAMPGDVVVFTGKGSEQFLVLPDNKRIDWDEKKVIEEALEEIQ